MSSRALMQFDIVFLLMAYHRPAYVVSMRGVCKLWADAGDKRISIAFNVDRILHEFFADTADFRSFMNRRDILVGGALVIDMFQPVSKPLARPDAPLEIFVEHSMGPDVVLYAGLHGFKLADDDAWNDRRLKNVMRVVQLLKNTRAINVHFTYSTPCAAIFSLPSTLDMHFFNGVTAFSMFPQASLLERRSLCLDYELPSAAPCFVDSAQFVVSDLCNLPSNVVTGCFASGDRWIGDRKCWTIRLPNYRVPFVTQAIPYSWCANGFSLAYELAYGPCEIPGRRIWYGVVHSDRLDHCSFFGWSYTVPLGFQSEFTSHMEKPVDGHGLWWRYLQPSAVVTDVLPNLIQQWTRDISDMPQLMKDW